MHVAQGDAQDLPYSITSKLTANNRLLRNSGFKHAIQGNNILDRQFKVFFIENKENAARLGIVASKKVFSRAVDRNYIKRIVREVFRKHTIKNLKLDLVVMVRRVSQHERKNQHDNLNALFSQIKNKCVK